MSTATTAPGAAARRRPPLVLRVAKDDAQERVTTSVDALREQAPQLSAHEVLTERQARVLTVTAAVLVVGVLLRTGATLTLLATVVTVLYACSRATCRRCWCTCAGRGGCGASWAGAHDPPTADPPCCPVRRTIQVGDARFGVHDAHQPYRARASATP